MPNKPPIHPLSRLKRDTKQWFDQVDRLVAQPLDVCTQCTLNYKHCACDYENYMRAQDDIYKVESRDRVLVAMPELLFEPQSGVASDISVTQQPQETQYQNVQFGDQNDPYLYDVEANVDSTRTMQDSSDVELGNFFSRPIPIYTETWAVGSPLSGEVNPWKVFFENPRVANRITNYNLLRANLHIKVVLNGNGFHYGRAIVAYLPMSEFDDLTTPTSLIRQDITNLSQMPHVYLDPTTSAGGEIKLPMFNYLNYIHIPSGQWDELGTIYLRSLNILRHANGATDNVTVRIFAWAEDVALSVPTSKDLHTLMPQSGLEVFEPQSGELDEANSKGFISGPATTVSRWASYLTKVPYIGPFALATEMAASTTASMAKIFGYCRPVVTKNPEPYRPCPVSSLALTNVPDGAQKLTVDAKQELSIDPRIAGLGGVDSMNIREIAKRESYLTTFDWDMSTTMDTLLWNARVGPVIWDEIEGPPKTFFFPACAFAALPFKYWTGTMKFRFQVVCSSFHKGRLRVIYDPNYISGKEYNVNYLKVIDIAEEQDFTIEIGNGQPHSLLDNPKPGPGNASLVHSTTQYSFSGPGNGVIGLSVVTELTTPNSTVTNNVEINVFVSAGDDFEVFVPDDHFQNFVFKPQSGSEEFQPQSGLVVPDSQNTSEPSAPVQMNSSIVGPGIAVDPQLNKVFTGESIASFRTMLKRYTLWSRLPLATANLGSAVVVRYPNFPYLRGNAGSAVDTTAASAPYNYCNTLLMHWVRGAYSGWRGSVRYKYIFRGRGNATINPSVQRAPYDEADQAYRPPFNINYPNPTTLGQTRFAVVSEARSSVRLDNENILTGYMGKAISQHDVNPNLEFEVPYYSFERFAPGKTDNYTGLMAKLGGSYDVHLDTLGDQGTFADIYAAAGEDFQVYFFTGLPRMYYESEPPAV